MKGKMIKSFIVGLALVLGASVSSPICASAAWKQDSNGWWNTEGSSYSTGWKQIDGAWYYFASNGYMQTGWVNDNGSWYYLNNSGAMKTGWINDNNSWYFLNASGVMQKGWINDNGAWYYTNENGAMHTGFLTLDNKTYYLNESGSMVTGDITLNGIKYSFNTNGEKIGLTTAESTESTGTTTENDTVKDETTSGGGGGGGSTSSTTIEDSALPSYSDLYGTWKVNSYISDSGIETNLAGLLINSAIGEKVVVSADKISSNGYSAVNPVVEESILTNAEFKSIWGVNLSKIGISDSKVKCLTITRSENSSQTVNVIATKDKKVVAIVEGAPFKLSKVK